MNPFEKLLSYFQNTNAESTGNGFVSGYVNPQFKTKSNEENYIQGDGDKENKLQAVLGKVFGPTTVRKEFNTEPLPPINLDQETPQRMPQRTAYAADLQNPNTDFSNYIRSQASSSANPENIKYLEEVVLPLTRQFGIPDAIAAGQWAAEGRFVNPNNNNYWNLMFDGQVHPYQSTYNNTSDYDLTLRDIIGTNMGVNPQELDYGQYDPAELIKYLQLNTQGQPSNKRFEAHSQFPSEYIDLIVNTPEFRNYYQ